MKNMNSEKTNMKTYAVPVSWEVSDFVFVKSTNLQSAVDYVLDNQETIPLGTEPEYIDASYAIDQESAKVFNDLNGAIVKVRGPIYEAEFKEELANPLQEEEGNLTALADHDAFSPFSIVDHENDLQVMNTLMKDIARNVAAIEAEICGAKTEEVYLQVKNLLSGYFLQQDASCREKAIDLLISNVTGAIHLLANGNNQDISFRLCKILEYLLLLEKTVGEKGKL